MLGAKGAVVFGLCEVSYMVVRDVEWGSKEFSSEIEYLIQRIGEW
jgi:hypothetical protein